MTKNLKDEVAEVWADVKGFEGKYRISSIGRVRSVKRDIILRPGNSRGYHNVTLSNGIAKKSTGVHRLVAQAFIPNPDNKPSVNHIDGNKINNSVGNLEWCTQAENLSHAFQVLGRTWHNAKLTQKQVEEIINLKGKISAAQIARDYGVHWTRVSQIHRGLYGVEYSKYRNRNKVLSTIKEMKSE